MPAPIRNALLLLAAAACLAACGGSPPPARATSEFTPEHAEVFEDSVDFVDDPTVLEGRWREDWSRDLDRRVGFSDLIALVKVSYLNTDTNLERVSTFRIVVSVERSLYGEAPEEEVTLIVREGEPGYGTVVGNERRILDQAFVAYIKWYQADASTVLPHWHLAPATEPVVRRTEYLIERRADVPDDTRTIEVVHQE